MSKPATHMPAIVQFDSLSWVSDELRQLLSDLQKQLEPFSGDYSENDMALAKQTLGQLFGTLSLIQVDGAAIIVDEIIEVLSALDAGKISDKEEVLELLVRSAIRVDDYLDYLLAGNADIPALLLPLINDLREARNCEAASEKTVFKAGMPSSKATIEILGVNAEQLQATAKKTRVVFQLGLINYLRNKDIGNSASRMRSVMHHLYEASQERLPANMWWIGCALVDVATGVSLEEKLGFCSLLSHLDRNIKKLIDNGEESLAENIEFDLIQSMLYYIAKSDMRTDRITKVKEVFHLDDFVARDLMGTRGWSGALNKQVVDTVSKAVNDDINEVKSIIDVYASSSSKDVGSLQNVSTMLQKIADTFAMLSLSGSQERIVKQKEQLDTYISLGKVLDNESVLDIASSLIVVSDDLQSYQDQKDGAGAGGTDNSKVAITLANEALRDIAWVKDVYLNYVDSNANIDIIRRAPKVLASVAGAMFINPLSGIVTSLTELRDYFESVLINNSHLPKAEEQDILAEVVINIEFFLEAVIDGRLDSELYIDAANIALDTLEDATPEMSVIEEQKEITEIKDDLEEIAADLGSPIVEVASLDLDAPAPLDEPKEEPGYQALQIVGADADSEIISIFIEEAEEEFERIGTHFPEWRVNPQNENALTTIRRSFHTLKGSGRIIGAQLMGEFAWKYETLLNRVIDGTITADSSVFDIIDEAIPVIPQLIAGIRENDASCAQFASELMLKVEKVSALEKGEVEATPTETTPAAEVAEIEAETQINLVEDKIEESDLESDLDSDLDLAIDLVEPESEPALELEPVLENNADELVGFDTELSDDLDSGLESDLESGLESDLESDLELGLDLNSEPELEVDFDESEEPALENDSALIEDEDDGALNLNDEPKVAADSIVSHASDLDLFEDSFFENNLSEDNTSLEGSDFLNESHDDSENLEIIPNHEHGVTVESEDIDATLVKIFSGEVDVHIRSVDTFITEAKESDVAIRSNEELYRAFHTLNGSAKTTPVFAEIAKISEGMENYCNGMKRLGIAWKDDDLQVLEESSEFIKVCVAAIAKNEIIKADTNLVERITLRCAELKGELTSKHAVIADVQMHELDEELVEIFMEEGEELIELLDSSIHRSLTSGNIETELPEILRVLHTLKGGARMSNLSAIGDLSHALESIFVEIAESRQSYDVPQKEIVQEASDELSNMLNMLRSQIVPPENIVLVQKLEDLVEGDSEESLPNDNEITLASTAVEDDDFDFSDTASSFNSEVSDIETEPESKTEFESFEFEHTAVQDELSSAFDAVQESDIEKLDEESSNASPVEKVSAPVKMGAESSAKNEVAANTAGSKQDQVRINSGSLDELVNYAGEVNIYQSRLGQYINDISSNLGDVDSTLERLRNQLRSMELETEAQISSRLEQERVEPDENFDPLEMDRYSNMQHLTRAISESTDDLMSIRANLNDLLKESEAAVLQQSRVTTDLQDGLLKTQMVNFQGLVSRLRRLVRQTSQQLDKNVELSIKGFDIEIDRSVQATLVASLEHIIRNAIYHGIEVPSQRIDMNKPKIGRVNMEVHRDGSYIVIDISDDGAGINPTIIRKKAIEKGLIGPNDELNEKETLQLILKSGFTTADEVSQIAGRGVGMDVVDAQLKELGGTLYIDSKVGKGSVFSIRLPQTLSINNGLMLNCNQSPYIVLLSAITGVATMNDAQIKDYMNGDFTAYEYGSDVYPVHYLGSLFGQPMPKALLEEGAQAPIVLIQGANRKLALIADEILGKREVVVKPLGSQLNSMRGISGASILSDGSVSFIIDAIELLEASVSTASTPDNTIEQMSAQEPERKTELKKKVMVVDDSITIRKVSQRLLERNGYEVITAKDGVDAIEVLQDVIPDIFLLDIEMPRMDGFELTSHIRSTSKVKELPIIMITSRTGEKHRQRAEALSVNAYMGKPFQELELMKQIEQLIGS